jgi:hypothetical protein
MKSAASGERGFTVTKQGSSKPGPSKAYLRLLHGRLTSKQYASQVKRSVDREVARTVEKATG